MTSIFETTLVGSGVLAQAQGQQQGGLLQMLPVLLVMGAVFYFLLIRPQQKQAKAHRQMLAQLKKGDGVVTSGGLIGRVVSIADKYIVIEFGRDAKVRVLKGSISAKAPEGLFESEGGFEALSKE